MISYQILIKKYFCWLNIIGYFVSKIFIKFYVVENIHLTLRSDFLDLSNL